MNDTLKKALWHKSESTWIQLFRYIFVAGAGLVLDFGGLFVLTEYAHFFYLVAATASFVLALIVNYFLSILWVFPSSRLSRRHEFMFFALIGLVGLGLNDLIIWLLTSKLGIFYLISKVVSTLLVFSWNFLARKFLLF